MSYVIHIWDRPSPADWDEAQALFGRLSGQPAAPNPKFVELGRRMKSVFPALGNDWTLSAPDGVVDEALWSLDIGDLTTLYPRLVDEALALGLSVYDDQAGECFVPGPWRLSLEGRERLAWPAPAPASRPTLDVEGRVRALVEPTLAAHGFHLLVQRESAHLLQISWARETPLGEQRISLGWKSVSDISQDASLTAEIRPTLPAELTRLCDPQRSISLLIVDAEPLRRFVGVLRSGRLYDNPIRISTAERLDDFLASTAAWLEAAMLPVLDQCRTAPDFLAYDLGEPRQPIAIKPHQANLVIAHWAGAADIERRFELLNQRCAHHNMTPFFVNATHRALHEGHPSRSAS